ncbi:hypothetical protein NEF87_000674 [Candidatus Lokiarchaeum ossiferum]|uniref:Cadherin domain-containing protein n=1 Tax=Candidatus Lokiarchaeum ossiferum TaxID=2951803 RepID=A0ABY6HPA5_9ARCH|nr:hypothetical protein NEF87_000674 [Candidatus Lokiarchaeum sp. B-35]
MVYPKFTLKIILIGTIGLCLFSLIEFQEGLNTSFSLNNKEEDRFQNIMLPRSNSEELSLDYSLIYNITKNGDVQHDIVPVNLSIQGTNGLLEDGSIEYSIPKNITDPSVLESLSLIFFEEQIQFIQDHSFEETYETYFSLRKEALSNDPADIAENGSYNFFWICDINTPPSSLKKYTNIPFTRLAYNIPIKEDDLLLTYPTWESDTTLFPSHQKLIEVFYLKSSQAVSGEYQYTIRLYYDKTNSILLKAESYYQKINTNEEYYVKIILRDTSLSLNLVDNGGWNGDTNDQPLLNHPEDISFDDDSQNSHVITWEIEDEINFYASYTIFTLNKQFGPFLWDNSPLIIFNVSDFADGDWNLFIIFEDGLGQVAIDSVRVLISPVPPIISTPSNIAYYSNSSSEYWAEWLILDNSTYHTHYSITLQEANLILMEGEWTNGDIIAYNVSSWPIGIWNLVILVSDGSSTPVLTDNVEIQVYNATTDQENRAPYIFASTDLEIYFESQENNFLNWYPVDYNTTSSRKGSLYLNNTLIMENIQWNSQELIEIELPYLTIGNYSFLINLDDGNGLNSTSEVQVSVLHAISDPNNPQSSNLVIISGPDLFYYDNSTTFQDITWIIIDFTRDSGSFEITLNSTNLNYSQNAWNSGEFIHFNVSDLNRGKYIFEIHVEDLYGQTHSDSINVWVLASNVNKQSKLWYLLIAIPVLSVGGVVYIYLKKKKDTNAGILDQI